MDGIKDIKLYTKCINFAAIKHRDQRRLDFEKTPYINHPIGILKYNCFLNVLEGTINFTGVANILSEEGNISDVSVLCAALLHDTVEDTCTSFSEILKNFGEEIKNIVEEVTDDKTLPKLERKRLQIEHANTISHKAKLVKMADKIYNLRDLQRCTPEGWTEVLDICTSEYFHYFNTFYRTGKKTISYGQNKSWRI